MFWEVVISEYCEIAWDDLSHATEVLNHFHLPKSFNAWQNSGNRALCNQPLYRLKSTRLIVQRFEIRLGFPVIQGNLTEGIEENQICSSWLGIRGNKPYIIYYQLREFISSFQDFNLSPFYCSWCWRFLTRLHFKTWTLLKILTAMGT